MGTAATQNSCVALFLVRKREKMFAYARNLQNKTISGSKRTRLFVLYFNRPAKLLRNFRVRVLKARTRFRERNSNVSHQLSDSRILRAYAISEARTRGCARLSNSCLMRTQNPKTRTRFQKRVRGNCYDAGSAPRSMHVSVLLEQCAQSRQHNV